MISNARRRELAALRDKRHRRKHGLLLVEGPVQLDTLLTLTAPKTTPKPATKTTVAAGAASAETRGAENVPTWRPTYRIKYLLMAEGADADAAVQAVRTEAEDRELDVLTLPSAEFAVLMDTQTPQGIAAVVVRETIPTLAAVISAAAAATTAAFSADSTPLGAAEMSAARIVVLDGVQDPGNLGTLIRCAAAFGAMAVILAKGCADATNPKAMRAAMGGLFAVTVLDRIDRRELAHELSRHRLPLIVADIGGVPFSRFAWPAIFALGLGAEVAGMSAELAALAGPTNTVGIPQAHAPQSINVAMAGSILLAHIYAQTHTHPQTHTHTHPQIHPK